MGPPGHQGGLRAASVLAPLALFSLSAVEPAVLGATGWWSCAVAAALCGRSKPAPQAGIEWSFVLALFGRDLADQNGFEILKLVIAQSLLAVLVIGMFTSFGIIVFVWAMAGM